MKIKTLQISNILSFKYHESIENAEKITLRLRKLLCLARQSVIVESHGSQRQLEWQLRP